MMDDAEPAAAHHYRPGAQPYGEMESPCDMTCCGDDECDFLTQFPFPFSLPERLYFRGEYLMWWSKAPTLPPLVTTSQAGTAQAQAGVLGLSTTSVLFGDGSTPLGMASGARLMLGSWLGPCQDTGVEVSYLFLGNQAATFSANEQTNSILARPILNVQSGSQNADLVAFPGVRTGAVNVRIENEVNSLEVLLRRVLVQDCGWRLDFLGGYRHGWFAEDLAIDTTSTVTATTTPVAAGTVQQLSDRFSTNNQFDGADLGFAVQTQYERWSLEFLTKLALGSTQSRVDIAGSTITTTPPATAGGTPVTVRNNGGLLALPSNIGHYEQRGFSVLPELGANLTCYLTPRLKATCGYTLLYWSRVARPGDEIDLNVNPSQFNAGRLSGLAAPQFRYITSDLWVQGLSFGLDYQF